MNTLRSAQLVLLPFFISTSIFAGAMVAVNHGSLRIFHWIAAVMLLLFSGFIEAYRRIDRRVMPIAKKSPMLPFLLLLLCMMVNFYTYFYGHSISDDPRSFRRIMPIYGFLSFGYFFLACIAFFGDDFIGRFRKIIKFGKNFNE